MANSPRAKSPDAPDLPDELDPYDGLLAHDGQPVVGRSLEDSALASPKSIGLRLRECILERVSCNEADVSSSGLRDVILGDCDLAGARVEAAEWRRVQIRGGRLTGLTAPRIKLDHVSFENLRLDYASFRFAELKCVRFSDCDLTETDFHGAKLEDVAFSGCRLRATDFNASRLQRVDFSESELSEIVITSAELPGAIVSPTQAAELAELFGLTVRWDD